jgi:hypothetical protein
MGRPGFHQGSVYFSESCVRPPGLLKFPDDRLESVPVKMRPDYSKKGDALKI